MRLYKNKKWMHEKYLDERLSMNEMAKLANCGQTTIKRWLQRFGISIRSQSETMRIITGKKYSGGEKDPLYENKEWLRERYWEDQLTAKEIGDIVGCDINMILRRLDEFGIERRPRSQISQMEWDKRLEDLTGIKFGKLTALEPAGTNHRHQRLWKCKCDCGNIVTKITTELKSKHVKSCGCMKYPSRMPVGQAAFNNLLYRYRRNAKNRGYKFELSREQFRKLTQEPCYYCDIPPAQSHYHGGNGAFIYNGIDRLDNDKGYTIDNIVPCCKQCNYAKGALSQDEFFSWIRHVYEHHMEN